MPPVVPPLLCGIGGVGALRRAEDGYDEFPSLETLTHWNETDADEDWKNKKLSSEPDWDKIISPPDVLRFRETSEVLPAAAGSTAADARVAARRYAKEEDAELHAGQLKTLCLLIGTAIVVGWGIVVVKSVMVPLILALLLTMILEPLLSRLVRFCRCFPSSWRRARFIRIIFAVVVCCIVLVLFIAGSGFLIYRSVISFPVDKYTNSIRLKRLVDYLTTIQKDLSGDDDNNEKVEEEVESRAEDTKKKLIDWAMDGPLLSLLGTALSVLSTLFLMFLFLMFLLVDKAACIADAQATHAEKQQTFWVKVHRSIKRYMVVKTLASLMICILTGILLHALDVDLAVLFAYLAFILNFIPHVGYTFSVAGPLILVYLDPDKSWSDLVLCVVFLTLFHQVVINVLEPRALAKSLDLHPMVVILSLAFWTVCWGAVGTLLSTPLICIMRLVLLEIDHPYAVRLAKMLEGRPFKETPLKSSLGPITRGKFMESEQATVAWTSRMAPPHLRRRHLTSVKYHRKDITKWVAARESEDERADGQAEDAPEALLISPRLRSKDSASSRLRSKDSESKSLSPPYQVVVHTATSASDRRRVRLSSETASESTVTSSSNTWPHASMYGYPRLGPLGA